MIQKILLKIHKRINVGHPMQFQTGEVLTEQRVELPLCECNHPVYATLSTSYTEEALQRRGLLNIPYNQVATITFLETRQS